MTNAANGKCLILMWWDIEEVPSIEACFSNEGEYVRTSSDLIEAQFQVQSERVIVRLVPNSINIECNVLNVDILSSLSTKIMDTSVNNDDHSGLSVLLLIQAELTEIFESMKHQYDSDGGKCIKTLVPDYHENELWCREWYRFEGIYQPKKRSSIAKFGRELGLNGFVCSGKPGIVMVEGPKSVVNEMLNFLRTDLMADVPRHARQMTSGLVKVAPFNKSHALCYSVPFQELDSHKDVVTLCSDWCIKDEAAIILNF